MVFCGPTSLIKVAKIDHDAFDLPITTLENLDLHLNKLADVNGLGRLTQLRVLYLADNPDLTKAQIEVLQATLPECKIYF